MQNEELILQIKDLKGYYKGSFGTVYSVDGVTLNVNKGDIVAIAGESGCGKSAPAGIRNCLPGGGRFRCRSDPPEAGPA